MPLGHRQGHRTAVYTALRASSALLMALDKSGPSSSPPCSDSVRGVLPKEQTSHVRPLQNTTLRASLYELQQKFDAWALPRGLWSDERRTTNHEPRVRQPNKR